MRVISGEVWNGYYEFMNDIYIYIYIFVVSSKTNEWRVSSSIWSLNWIMGNVFAEKKVTHSQHINSDYGVWSTALLALLWNVFIWLLNGVMVCVRTSFSFFFVCVFVSYFKKSTVHDIFFFYLLKLGQLYLILQGLYNVQIFHVNWDYSEKI